MTKKMKSIKGRFGQTIHYENGVKVGESWPGLLEGSQNHYDADGKYAGYSDRGFIADQVHHDANGRYIGETHTGFFGQKKHYSADRGYVGETWDGLFRDTTDLFVQDPDSGDSPSNDELFGGDDW